MIAFNYQTDFKLEDSNAINKWLIDVSKEEGLTLGDIDYVFCSDEYLIEINQKFLNHDTYTDIITFDYSVGKKLQGEIYISIDRVRENAIAFNQEFNSELLRVLVHGILHMCGYKDKSESEANQMRAKEEYYINMC